MLSFDLNLSFY